MLNSIRKTCTQNATNPTNYRHSSFKILSTPSHTRHTRNTTYGTFLPFSGLTRRQYASLSKKSKKEKVSIGEKIKSWSEKGLLKSADQIKVDQTSENLNSHNSSSLPSEEPSITTESVAPEPIQLTSTQIELQEYVELCKSIIEGRPLESVVIAPKSRSSRTKTKSRSSKNDVPSNEDEEAPSPAKRKRRTKENISEISDAHSDPVAPSTLVDVPQKTRKRRSKSISAMDLVTEPQTTLLEDVLPQTLIIDSPINSSTIESPRKPRRRSKILISQSEKPIQSDPITHDTSLESPPVIDSNPTASVLKSSKKAVSKPTELHGGHMDASESSSLLSSPITPEPPALRWNNDTEIDLEPILERFSPSFAEYDQKLRNSEKFDKFAPLGASSLRFWQKPFEWDDAVLRAASRYIDYALTAKEALDPSFQSNLHRKDVVTFKPLQLEAINMALAGKDVFLALSTGGGKTMCYVLPALLTKGLTVVVSPLIALIQDQVTLLDSMGIAAAGLSCQMSHEELESVYSQLLSENSFKVIYVTPERIGQNERFMNVLIELNRRKMLQRVVVDEAHCISEWGHDFRKDYRRLSILKETIPSLPIMAVTGTCTPAVRKDIAEQLKIEPSHFVLQTSFNRPNLWFQVAAKSDETPMADMLFYILNHQLANECGIIYAMTTKDAERLAEFFADHGLSTAYYHGAMTPSARQESHAKWARGEAKLMCTTVAFGLGIDKSNVRYVLHSTMPTSLEAYYQQAGRAGRDGNSSDCVLFFHAKDRVKIEYVIKLNAHLMRQRKMISELNRLRKEAEMLSKPKRGKKKPVEEVDESAIDSVSIVDIVEIPEDGMYGFAKLRREDGSEIQVDSIFDAEESAEDAFIRQMKTEKLDDVTSFCREKKVCRRVHLMRFFGQKFVTKDCEHTCDVCNPTRRRTTDKLTKVGLAEWEALKLQREERRRETEKPISETVKKIQAILLDQEEADAREANRLAKIKDEEEYERQFERRPSRSKGETRPAKPTKFGATSPLARKLRQSSASTLGDPTDYEHLEEHLLSASTKRKRATSKTKSEDSPPTSPALELLQEQVATRPKIVEARQTSIEHVEDQKPSSHTMDELFASIARVSAEKLKRRLAKKKTPFQMRRHAETDYDESDDNGEQTKFVTQVPSNSKREAEVVPAATNTKKNVVIRTSEDAKLLSEVKKASELIAAEKHTTVKNLLSQNLLKEIVKAKPMTALDLAAIKGVGPRRAQIFAPFLLPIFQPK